jgi:hypothetical protein
LVQKRIGEWVLGDVQGGGACSMKFPVAPESTKAVETHEGQPANGNQKGFDEIDDGILMPTLGDG